MSHQQRKRRSRYRRVKNILLAPFYVIADMFIGLKDALDQTLLFLGLKKGLRGRRNKDFDRAGRESTPRMTVDTLAASQLKKAHKIRASETIDAGFYEKRMLGRKTEEAKELRETMTKENKSVSSGSVVSHLAKMQRKSVSEPNRVSDDSTSESTPLQPGDEPHE